MSQHQQDALRHRSPCNKVPVIPMPNLDNSTLNEVLQRLSLDYTPADVRVKQNDYCVLFSLVNIKLVYSL